MRRLSFFPCRVIQLQVLVRIAMRPTIHSDRQNVSLMLEAVLTKQTLKLIPDFLFVCFKRGCVDLVTLPQHYLSIGFTF